MHRLTFGRLFAGFSCALAITISQETRAQEFNYFGDCHTDEMIYAANGNWYYDGGYGTGTVSMVHGGTYQTLANGVITVFSKNDPVHAGKIFTHVSLINQRCR